MAAIAITGGETAILKATRRLKLLARVQGYTALASVVISVPLYYFMSYSGILPAIILMALFAAVATVVCSYRCYPFKMDFSRSMLRDGMAMIRLGLAFVLAAALGSLVIIFFNSLAVILSRFWVSFSKSAIFSAEKETTSLNE